MSAAQAQIYRCVDASGHKEYTDRKKGNHCVALDLPDPVIAAPQRREGQARPRSATGAGTTAAAAMPAPAASAFPRVDSAEQKARDADRRQILTDELNAEQQKLGELRREFNNGEPERRGDERNYAKYQERVANLKTSIARSEQNVEALKREIANIR
jgi:predicted RNase H-like nuclease (RuvC/YqgF family)